MIEGRCSCGAVSRELRWLSAEAPSSATISRRPAGTRTGSTTTLGGTTSTGLSVIPGALFPPTAPNVIEPTSFLLEVADPLASEFGIIADESAYGRDIGAAFQITRGFEVNDDTIAFDVLKELGPANSQYMAHEHTVRYLRKVYWRPKLTNRDKWETWLAKGGQDMRDRAREQALLDEALSRRAAAA